MIKMHEKAIFFSEQCNLISPFEKKKKEGRGARALYFLALFSSGSWSAAKDFH